MKKILFATVVLVLNCISLKAQSFVCTDLSFYGSDLSPKEIQNEKMKSLGSKATITIFDKYIKSVFTNNKGRVESYVLDKVDDTKYQYSEKTSYGYNYKIVVKLQKMVAYIKGFTVEVYKDYKLEGTLTFKRE